VDTPPIDTPPVDTPPVELQAGEWFRSPGVKGEGDKPDFYMNDKYGSLEDQAKAYPELAKQMGDFSGAPKDGYKVTVSDLATEAGFTLDADDPLLEGYIKHATDRGMSQKVFDEGIEVYAQIQLAQNEASNQANAKEMEELGKDGATRIQDLHLWADANMPEDLAAGMKSFFSTAVSVQAGEHLVQMLLEAGTNPGVPGNTDGMTEADLQAMQFKEDEHGNRLTHKDPAYRKKFEEASRRFYGTKEQR
jgi:hypothetical protein